MHIILIKKQFFLTCDLSLINTCCWRADHKILIHNSTNQSELIFVSAQQHDLVSNNSLVRINYFAFNFLQNKNIRILQRFKMDSLEVNVARSQM